MLHLIKRAEQICTIVQAILDYGLQIRKMIVLSRAREGEGTVVCLVEKMFVQNYEMNSNGTITFVISVSIVNQFLK